MGILFQICCGIMTLISIIFGISYEAANTYLFLYTEPIILMATCIIGLYIILRKNLKKLSFIRLLVLSIFIISFIIHLNVLLIIIADYWTIGIDEACIKAYKDLKNMGELTEMGYVGINLFLFIILFLSILLFNLSPVIYNKIKTYFNK